ncbi:hypothetical protein PsorP6_010724 [Peronosclerospora sorghi]|uniref:Uncharacterized protein n=1 Tax=Peronosclerospora sorghi TaxID=230839 RepID=A0ACC0VVU4_9STRA|nr:hypothetical protein PsorP6_010724 [Peronosclerospora sorghi]
MARHRETQDLVLLKLLDRRVLRERGTRRRLRREVRVLELARGHPNLLQLYEVQAVGTRIELCFELARGGPVLLNVRSERDVSRVLQQAAHGLDFLHARGILHGEIRPEHLLFSDDEPDARVLLTSFGRAGPWKCLTLRTRPSSKGFLWDDVHHIRFLPPFLLRRKSRLHGKKRVDKDDDGQCLVTNWSEAQQVDTWALGITLYLMLCGCYPFSSEDERDTSVADIERRVLREKLTFPDAGTRLSRAAKDLLVRLLERNSCAGISIKDVLAHPWLNGSVAPASSWRAEILAQRDVFIAGYAEAMAPVARHRSESTGSTSNVLNGHNDAMNGSAGRVSTVTSLDGARSSLHGDSGTVVRTRDSLEVEAEEGEARPSFMSTHGTQLLLEEEAQEERPSADRFMRLASLEMGKISGSNDEDLVAEPEVDTSREVLPGSKLTADTTVAGSEQIFRQRSLDKIWQVLLRQRRFRSLKSQSSGSGNDIS